MTEQELMTKWCPEFSSPGKKVKCFGSECAWFRSDKKEIEAHDRQIMEQARSREMPPYLENSIVHAWCGKAGKDGSN